MGLVRDGIPAASGIVIAPAHVLRWDVPRVPEAQALAAGSVEVEIERFRAACAAATADTQRLQQETAARLGPVEAQIFEPQILMLQDPDLVDRTETYIRENHLGAARAFEVRVLEWESQWSHTAHPMVLDKLNDLADVHARVFRHLLGLPQADPLLRDADHRVILVAADVAPSLVARMDPQRVVGLALYGGTRASHTSILARSLGIPAVVSLGELTDLLEDGTEMILDGGAGRIVIGPSEEDRRAYRERDFRNREWEQEQLLLSDLEPITLDGFRVALRANLDLPGDALSARAHGAAGVGLLRTEFLVVGRATAPGEQEQYLAYRGVTEAFEGAPVIIRTYDLGGDKFPPFLHMVPEENPFLGWRAIRVCLDEPALFRAQLRALLRAAAHGDVRVMLPLVNDVAEIEATRRLMREVAAELRSEGTAVDALPQLGAMIETPAAAVCAPTLARHVDFFSVGTNDLVQYTLAVDRGNARLSRWYKPFHPAVVRLLHSVARTGAEAGIEVSVCGELAAHPLGAYMLVGMGIPALSVGTSALVEVRRIIRSTDRAAAGEAVARALEASTADEVTAVLADGLDEVMDVDIFAGSVGLPVGD